MKDVDLGIMSYTVYYEANNSGGHWWHSEDDCRRLLSAGWEAQQSYFRSISDHPIGTPEREQEYRDWEQLSWFSDLDEFQPDGLWDRPIHFRKTVEASSFNEALRQAVEEFQSVTGLNPRDEGCNCCGPPHSFHAEDEDGNVEYLYVEYPSRGSLPWD